MNEKNTRGFTLIEMSIVIVIIGLIIGSVVAGQSLIRQSRLNSAIADEQRYVQAVANFQQKYSALPGDFSAATNFWSVASTCPPTYASQATNTTTCNGDGNGQIGNTTTSQTSAPSEDFLFWQHLALAQMIPGAYNPSPGSGGTADHVIGNNSPATKAYGLGFGLTYIGTITNTNTTYGDKTYASDFYANNFGHVMTLGAYLSNNLPIAAGLTQMEAIGVDSKYDDGYPGSGTIQTWNSASSIGTPACSTSTTAYASSSSTTYACSLIFITGF